VGAGGLKRGHLKAQAVSPGPFAMRWKLQAVSIPSFSSGSVMPSVGTSLMAEQVPPRHFKAPD